MFLSACLRKQWKDTEPTSKVETLLESHFEITWLHFSARAPSLVPASTASRPLSQ